MGQKVSPHGLRVGIIKDWSSRWFAPKKKFGEILAEDKKIRNYIKKNYYNVGISKIGIKRVDTKITITLLVENPGYLVGTKGVGINALRKNLAISTNRKDREVEIEVEEVTRPEFDAQLTAEKIANNLEKRMVFRRAMKMALNDAINAGVKGIKMVVAGRLNGADIARAEKYNFGNVPLHTLRMNVDYGFAEALTTYGKLGVKVWINKGEYLEKELIDDTKNVEIVDDSDIGKVIKKDKPTARRSKKNTRTTGKSHVKIVNPRNMPKVEPPAPVAPEETAPAEATDNAPAPETDVPTPADQTPETTAPVENVEEKAPDTPVENAEEKTPEPPKTETPDENKDATPDAKPEGDDTKDNQGE